MQSPARVLVFQTSFTGDVVLTLPVLQALRERLPDVMIDMVVIPSVVPLLAHHPDIHTIIPYDKKRSERGIIAGLSLALALRKKKYDVAIIPHRSIRSALICYLAGIPRRIGFSTSAGRFLLSDVVRYQKDSHEVVRNLSLLAPLGVSPGGKVLPLLYPSAEDVHRVDAFLESFNTHAMVAVAPGSVWATKRWLPERFGELAGRLTREGLTVVLLGGAGDRPIGTIIETIANSNLVVNAMGKLSILQSAELIRRCKVAVTNDSSPLHLAVAMRTPVVAIFGATVPEFGFGPLGDHDVVIETAGLDCRPCAIHGGDRCPISTFDCMKNIQVERVLAAVQAIISGVRAEAV